MRLGVIHLPHFSDLQGLHWGWPHFSPAELADVETGELVVVPDFLDWLEGVRHAHAKPMIINDGTRTSARQIKHSGSSTGSHVDGMAVDVAVHGEDAEQLERIAVIHGVLGRGIYQNRLRANGKRFLHLDMWTKAPPGLRPRLWS